MSEFICEYCCKEFPSKYSLSGHKRTHTAKEPYKKPVFFCEDLGREATIELIARVESYNKNPKKCIGCTAPISYKRKENNYCNHSCAATATNLARPPKSAEQRVKISNSMKSYNKTLSKTEKFKIDIKRCKTSSRMNKVITRTFLDKNVGPSCKIFHCTCSHCQMKFITRNQVKYCSNCAHLYKSNNNRNQFAFTFNVYKFPELFDLSLITKFGWHSYGGRKLYNPNGVTKDHRVSVNAAIKNSYDPYYIKHPMNCELMRFEDNNKKKTGCSITYEELVSMVDEFDKKTEPMAPFFTGWLASIRTRTRKLTVFRATVTPQAKTLLTFKTM